MTTAKLMARIVFTSAENKAKNNFAATATLNAKAITIEIVGFIRFK